MYMGSFLNWYTTVVLSCLLLSTSSSCPLILHHRDPVVVPQGNTAPGLKTYEFSRILLGPTISLPSLYLANRTAKCVSGVFCIDFAPPVPLLYAAAASVRASVYSLNS